MRKGEGGGRVRERESPPVSPESDVGAERPKKTDRPLMTVITLVAENKMHLN
jgi:hypothetical protein